MDPTGFNRLGLLRNFLIILCLVLFTALSGGCGGGTDGTGLKDIQGTLKTSDNAGVPDAWLSVLETGDQTVSDEEGNFRLESYFDIPEVSILVEPPGLPGSRVTLSEIPEGNAKLIVALQLNNNGLASLTALEIIPEEATPPPAGSPHQELDMHSSQLTATPRSDSHTAASTPSATPTPISTVVSNEAASVTPTPRANDPKSLSATPRPTPLDLSLVGGQPGIPTPPGGGKPTFSDVPLPPTPPPTDTPQPINTSTGLTEETAPHPASTPTPRATLEMRIEGPLPPGVF